MQQDIDRAPSGELSFGSALSSPTHIQKMEQKFASSAQTQRLSQMVLVMQSSGWRQHFSRQISWLATPHTLEDRWKKDRLGGWKSGCSQEKEKVLSPFSLYLMQTQQWVHRLLLTLMGIQQCMNAKMVRSFTGFFAKQQPSCRKLSPANILGQVLPSPALKA